jgi:hypothetical protein
VIGKGGGWVNTVQKMCKHACNCNNDTRWNYSMNGEGAEFKYDTVDIL